MSHIYRVQGITHIEGLIFHIRQGSLVGQILEAQFEQCSLEIGVGTHLLDLSYNRYNILLTDCWAKSTWEFCHKYNIQIKGEYKLPTLQRENNFFPMQELVESNIGLFDKKELHSINKSRIFMKCVTAADIYTTDGKRISQRARFGTLDKFKRSVYQWPMQVAPTKADWRAWRKAIDYLWEKQGLQLVKWQSLQVPLVG